MPEEADKYKVSVIITAYNRVNTIGCAIESVLAQDFDEPFEIIIGDDGSTDGTREICLDFERKYSGVIRVVQHKENCGLGKNWALLTKSAKGKYIATCDDDDFWHNKQKLKLQVDFLDKNLDYGMVHTEKNVLNTLTNKIKYNYYKENEISILEGYILKDIFTGRVPICVSSTLIRHDIVKKYVPLDLYIENRFNVQDWPTWMFIAKYCKIGYLPASTTTYRVGHSSITNDFDFLKKEKKVEADHLMYKLICSYLPEELHYDEQSYNSYKLNILLSVAYSNWNYKKAKEYLILYDIHNGNDVPLKVKMAKLPMLFYVFACYMSLKKKSRKIFF